MTTAVQGVGWRPEEDMICFKASLNFPRKGRTSIFLIAILGRAWWKTYTLAPKL